MSRSRKKTPGGRVRTSKKHIKQGKKKIRKTEDIKDGGEFKKMYEKNDQIYNVSHWLTTYKENNDKHLNDIMNRILRK